MIITILRCWTCCDPLETCRLRPFTNTSATPVAGFVFRLFSTALRADGEAPGARSGFFRGRYAECAGENLSTGTGGV